MLKKFNSKKYIEYDKFKEFRFDHMEEYELLEEQVEVFENNLRGQSIQYSFEMKEGWVEETLLGMGEKNLTLYTSLATNKEKETFINKVISYFGYFYAGSLRGRNRSKEETREKLYSLLSKGKEFFVEKEILYFNREPNVIQVIVSPQGENGFTLKALEVNVSDGVEKDVEEMEKLSNIIDEKLNK